MLKKIFGFIGAFALVMALAGVSLAGTITGEIVKIEGDMVSVKDSGGKIHQIHVDPAATKKSGELKQGDKVKAEVDEKGHASSVESQKS
ncbi:MAG: hypothetical protein HY282_07685 [Nitrospirae bacterium]|nr:hypothetical protein [Candidatus Manganitrophaceae bacterium]